MKPFRVSIAGLMAVVLLVAVGVAALRSASDLWAGALFTLALGVLAIAALGAVSLRGRQRASWAGFAALGWGYLLLAFGPWCDTAIRPRLLTTKLLDILAAWKAPAPQGIAMSRAPQPLRLSWDVSTFRPATGSDSSTILLDESMSVTPSNVVQWLPPVTPGPAGPSRESSQDIGHALAALLVAFLGGRAALFFVARREAAEAAEATHG
jgi:hypothetical protein